MSTFSSPKVESGMKVEDLANLVAMLIEEIDYLLNGNVDAKNIRANSITAKLIEVGAIRADMIDVTNGKITVAQIVDLIVGGNVVMGPNATISWNKVSDQPDIPELPGYIKSTYIDATNVRSPNITGGIITGPLIRTAETGSRMEISERGVRSYNNNNQLEGMVVDNGNFSFIDFYFQGQNRGGIAQVAGVIQLISLIGSVILRASEGSYTRLRGNVSFEQGSGETVTGIPISGVSGLEARLASIESRLSDLENRAFVLAYMQGNLLVFNSKNVAGVDSVFLP